jgi:hypothetical protein
MGLRVLKISRFQPFSCVYKRPDERGDVMMMSYQFLTRREPAFPPGLWFLVLLFFAQLVCT